MRPNLLRRRVTTCCSKSVLEPGLLARNGTDGETVPVPDSETRDEPHTPADHVENREIASVGRRASLNKGSRHREFQLENKVLQARLVIIISDGLAECVDDALARLLREEFSDLSREDCEDDLICNE